MRINLGLGQRLKGQIVDEIQPHRGRDFPALTGLRGFAALWVLTYHAWIAAGPKELTIDVPLLGLIEYHPLFGVGWAGVQIFFALSAFLLALPFAEASIGVNSRPTAKRSFFLKRLIRVFPAYYLQLAILLLIAIWTDSLGAIETRHSIYFLTMNFMPEPLGYGLRNDVNGVWWTLPVELSFYLLLPFLGSLAMGRGRWKVFLGLLFFVFAWRYSVIALAPIETKTLWFSQLPGSMDSFAIGMICAYLFVKYETLPPHRQTQILKCGGLAISAAFVLIIGLVYWLDYIYWIYRTNHPISYIWTPLLSAGFGVLIFFSALQHRLLNTIFGNRVLCQVGVISYGIYLWHLPVAQWFSNSSVAQSENVYLFPHYLFVMVVGASLIASASWLLVEKPSIRIVRNHLIQKNRSKDRS